MEKACESTTHKTLFPPEGNPRKEVYESSSIPEIVLLDVLLLREARDRPDLHLDAGVELLAAHVPHALVGQRRGLGAAAVEQLRRVEHAALDLRHLRRDRDAELVRERVVRELRAADLE